MKTSVESTILNGKDTYIIVLDRGFVYVGIPSIKKEFLTVANARCIRIWGTTQGLAELSNGPTVNTKLDQVCELLVPMKAVIHLIKCSKNW